MFNTVILLGFGSSVPIEQHYPLLFILSAARQYIYKLCTRNTWKVAYSYKNTYVNIRLYGSGSHKL